MDTLKLVFATGNANKLKEARGILGKANIKILSLEDINYSEGELEESHQTLEANAAQKAWFIFDKYYNDCFSEDTGLEVQKLNGAPGVYSARYSGEGRSAVANMNLVLKKMEGATDRTAQFRTVICLIIHGVEHIFEGVVKGEILTAPRGEGGFGYDPIFQPTGYELTFAEMDIETKNKISHRAKAFQKMNEFLENQYAHLC